MADRFLAEHLLTDLYTYTSDGLGFTLYDEPHRHMAAYFEAALPPPPDLMRTADQRYTAYAAPRETLKTSIGVQGLAEFFLLKWKHTYGHDGRVLIVRAAREASEGVLMAIREDFSGTNPVLHRAFGDLSLNSPLWKNNAIVLGNRQTSYRDPSIDTAGTGMSKTGGHFDLILLDDLCNEKNFESEVEMMRARRYIQACMPILNQGGSIVHIGTRWSNLDTTGWILDQNDLALKAGADAPWHTEIHSCYNPDGTLFYPAYLTEKRIDQKRRGMEDRLFSSQYLNQIVGEASQVFRPEWLQYYDGDFEPDGEDIATLKTYNSASADDQFAVSASIVIDPAATATSSSNATAMALILTDAKDQMWVHDTWKGRELPASILDRILGWCARYRPARLSIDTLGQQVLWIDPIVAMLRRADIPTQVILHRGKAVTMGGETIKAGRGILSKASRIESLQPFFREGKIKLRRGRCQPLIHEYNTYTGPTHQEHYDMLDALAQGPAISKRPRVERFHEIREKDEWRQEFAEEREVIEGRVRATSTGRRYA